VTVRPEVVRTRLAQLARILAELRRLRQMPSSAREALHELALERGLHVCAEAIFDVGHHVLAGRGLQIPATYREVIPALVAAGVLTAQLGGRLTGLAGLRNLLVHDYAVIDAPVLWQLLEDRLDDLELAHAELSALRELA
jgi:uncharacterized protein YutE (UPF0331/DUF86 family)